MFKGEIRELHRKDIETMASRFCHKMTDQLLIVVVQISKVIIDTYKISIIWKKESF